VIDDSPQYGVQWRAVVRTAMNRKKQHVRTACRVAIW